MKFGQLIEYPKKIIFNYILIAFKWAHNRNKLFNTLQY